MAINITNYVDISTQFPDAGVAGRALGGLVFTASPMIDPAEPNTEIQAAYDLWSDTTQTCVVALSLSQVSKLFGATSAEYKFAEGYYGYISPSGRFASVLQFSRVSGTTTPVQAFENVNTATNQFGSFTFLSLPDGPYTKIPTADDLTGVAAKNNELDTKYLFVVNYVASSEVVSPTTVTNESKKFANYRGTCFVYGATEASAYMPMAIFAATDYNDGQVTNFMFKQFSNEQAAVASDSFYTAFNTAEAPVNFYGLTQSNGQELAFYQRGFNTNKDDTAVYCNEVWFKASCETALVALLVAQDRIPAAAEGVGLVTLTVMDSCSQAQNNGMFMAKTLTALNRRDVREIILRNEGSSSDVESIVTDVETKGYSIYAYLRTSTSSLGGKLAAAGERYIVYYVFYGTADSVRYVKGVDILLK